MKIITIVILILTFCSSFQIINAQKLKNDYTITVKEKRNSSLKTPKVLTENLEYFLINNKIDTLFTLKNGLKIFIPEGSFSKSENIKIEVSTYSKYGEFLFANLNTHTQNGYLQSGGMLNIQFYKNDSLIKPQKAISYYFPKIENNKKMKIYALNNKMLWEEDTTCSICNDNIYSEIQYLRETNGKIKAINSNIFSSIHINPFNNRIDIKNINLYILSKIQWRKADLQDFSQKYIEIQYSIEQKKLVVTNGLNYRFNSHLNEILNSIPDSVIKFSWNETKGYIGNLIFVSKFAYINYSNNWNNKLKEYSISFKNTYNTNDYEILSTIQTGWLNQDKLFKETLNEEVIISNTEKNEILAIIYKNKKVLINGLNYNNSTYFKNIPVNNDAYLIGVKTINNKQYLAFQKVNFKLKTQTKLDYKLSSIEEIKKFLNEFK